MNKLMIFINGFFIVIMNTFNGMLTGSTSVYWTSAVHHVLSLVFMFFIYIALDKNKFRMGRLEAKYYLPGVMSAGTVMIASACIANIGATFLIVFNLVGQVLISLAIDEFGLFGMEKVPFRKRNLIGYSFILAGIFIMFS